MWAFLAAGGAQLQDQLGLSATRAGLALLPVGVGIVLAGALLVTPLRRRFGSVPVAVAGLAAGGTGLAWLAAGRPVLPARPVAAAAAGRRRAEPLLDRAEGVHARHRSGRRAGCRGRAFEAATHVGGAVAVACFAAVLAVARS